MKKYYSVYEKSALFQGIGNTQMHLLLEELAPFIRDYSHGSIVLFQGETVQNIGLILEGSVQGIKNNYSGNEVLVTEMGPGDLFGEFLVCKQEQESPINIKAKGNATIAFISFDALIDCGTRNRMLLKNLFSVFSTQYFALQRKLDYLSQKSIRDRLLAFMCDMHYEKKTTMFELPFSQTMLADYLGVDRSAMARELSHMKRDGLLDYYGRSIKLYPCAQCNRRR